MTDDLVLAAVQRFMDAVELRLTKQADETRSAVAEIRSSFAEMQTRAMQSGPQGERGEPGIQGVDGRGVSVTLSATAPMESRAGDIWIVP